MDILSWTGTLKSDIFTTNFLEVCTVSLKVLGLMVCECGLFTAGTGWHVNVLYGQSSTLSQLAGKNRQTALFIQLSLSIEKEDQKHCSINKSLHHRTFSSARLLRLVPELFSFQL